MWPRVSDTGNPPRRPRIGQRFQLASPHCRCRRHRPTYGNPRQSLSIGRVFPRCPTRRSPAGGWRRRRQGTAARRRRRGGRRRRSRCGRAGPRQRGRPRRAPVGGLRRCPPATQARSGGYRPARRVRRTARCGAGPRCRGPLPELILPEMPTRMHSMRAAWRGLPCVRVGTPRAQELVVSDPLVAVSRSSSPCGRDPSSRP